MLPQSRPSKFTVSARFLRVECPELSILTDTYDYQCFGPAACTSVAQSAQTESFEVNHSDETAIVSPREDGKVDRPTASIPEGTTLNKPDTYTSPIHVGPRPLILGTYKIATSSLTPSSKSRPSSSSFAPRTPTIRSARWSSYTTPFPSISQPSPSTMSDEVETLTAQLAASEARVKQLVKEKSEAVSASHQLFLDITNFQDERSQWLKEREELMTKLGLLDEVEATPVLLPPTGGAWFAGSSQEQHPPSEQSNLLSTTRISGPERDLGIALSEARQDAEAGLSRPGASDAHSQSMVSEMRDTDDDALARIGSIFLYSTPQADGCDPGNTPSPATCKDAEVELSRPAASDAHSQSTVSETSDTGSEYNPGSSTDEDVLARIGSIFLDPPTQPPRAHRRSHRRRNAIEGSQPIPPIVKCATLPSQTPLPTCPPPTSLNAPEFSCVPGNPAQLLVPPPIPSVSAPAQARPLQPKFDLASRMVESDAGPGYSGRQELNTRAKSLVKDVKAAAGIRPSIDLVIGAGLHASMARVSTSTGRPRIAPTRSWQASEQPQIQLHPHSTLDEGFATTEEHARVSLKPKRGRPSPLRARGFTPCSSPLARTPEDADEAQPRARGLMPCSSPLVDTPENAPGAQPKKGKQFRKLFKQARYWILRLV